ncbi:MAG: 2,3-bisphosphoglycerate-independent phosphoglycerate mutase [Candidatus Diapherotrites archaeon]|nr:2,3-bisphosphoglycerate-independent phosphoglycerate mutase [Candidatus Diapherotrites archaeon]
MHKPFVLIVLDGWGHSTKRKGNAIRAAQTPNFDALWKRYPHCLLKTWGNSVGLPAKGMGGSEVGHLTLGAGRVVEQEALLIDRAIKDRSFKKNPALVKACSRKRVHFMGLLSDQYVHSHINHLLALLRLRPDAFVHAFLDGRDTPPKSAAKYLRMTKRQSPVASIMGRYYAMDRDNRWDRTELAFSMLRHGKGFRAATAMDGLAAAYARGETDEFVKPTLVNSDAVVRDGDGVVFFNFRPDRARQLTELFLSRTKTAFTSMTQYSEGLKTNVAFRKELPKNTFGEMVSRKGLKQLRIAETEKYAHVTYFFSGGREKAFPGEKRIIVPSPKVATYDLKPEMNASKVTEKLLQSLHGFDFVVVNYANCDMVGHTGVFSAAVKAVEAVDECLGRVIARVQELGGQAIILADHGNAEEMIMEDGSPATYHSFNRVPCIAVTGRKICLRDGALFNVAPTILELMGLSKPKEMDWSLIAR